MNIREISEEISAVEQTLNDIGETGNQRVDDLIRIAKTRLGHANGHLVAKAIQAESANSPNREKSPIGAFPD